MKTEIIHSMIGDVQNALTWLDEAWKAQAKDGKSEAQTKYLLVEAGERLQGAAQQIAVDLGWVKEWKRRDDPKGDAL